MEKTGGEKDKTQTGKRKPFPTKMTTDGSFGSLWHLLFMDGCLQPFCALKTLPSTTDQASPAPTDGRNGRGGPPIQATSPQTPAASHQRQPPGPRAAPTDSVCQRQEARGGRTTRRVEEARGSRPVLALLGTDMPHRYFGTPGRVLRPASISALWPLSLCGPHLEGHISLCNLSPPHPGMRGHAAPDPPASSRTWKVSAL